MASVAQVVPREHGGVLLVAIQAQEDSPVNVDLIPGEDQTSALSALFELPCLHSVKLPGRGDKSQPLLEG